MNRIAILLLILLASALAILLVYRSDTSATDDFDLMVVQRQPEAALEQVNALLLHVHDGAAAARKAREILNTIIDDGTNPDSTLKARRRLAELERILGNDEAAGEAILDAIQAHPGNRATPEMLLDLGLLLEGPLDRPGEARKIFNTVVRLFPEHPLAPEATIRLARIRMEADPHGKGVDLSDVHKINRTNPDHPLADEALFLIDQFSTELEEHE